MNHKQNAIRFFIVIFWLASAGLIFSAISNGGNAWALSWATWLLYLAIATPIAYIGIVTTKNLWNSK